MKTTSLKTIHLTRKELKVAIHDFLIHRSGRPGLADHLLNNKCEMIWAQKQGQDPVDFLISIDGEVDD